jgi:serine/threonine protein kinase
VGSKLMARKYRKGVLIGPWTLIKRLGRGGNAEVWQAMAVDDRSVALKILHTRQPTSEPYRRFKNEVEILGRLEGRRGVLPLIEATLPDQPTDDNPAWLAMPVATGIREALGRNSRLESVVDAITVIAETLAGLASDRISHRDIKPENLYSYAGEYAVGDFGLVDYPNKEPLTKKSRHLGPLYFHAPEMLSNPANAEGVPADVFSLAKTLWVLAAGQQFPPPGELRVDTAGLRLSSFVDHPKALLLDNLLESATRFDPAQRPSMARLAQELREWRSLSFPSAAASDLSSLATRLMSIMEERRQVTSRADALRKKGEVTQRQLREILVEVGAELREAELVKVQLIPRIRSFIAP